MTNQPSGKAAWQPADDSASARLMARIAAMVEEKHQEDERRRRAWARQAARERRREAPADERHQDRPDAV